MRSGKVYDPRSQCGPLRRGLGWTPRVRQKCKHDEVGSVFRYLQQHIASEDNGPSILARGVVAYPTCRPVADPSADLAADDTSSNLFDKAETCLSPPGDIGPSRLSFDCQRALLAGSFGRSPSSLFDGRCHRLATEIAHSRFVQAGGWHKIPGAPHQAP